MNSARPALRGVVSIAWPIPITTPLPSRAATKAVVAPPPPIPPTEQNGGRGIRTARPATRERELTGSRELGLLADEGQRARPKTEETNAQGILGTGRLLRRLGHRHAS